MKRMNITCNGETHSMTEWATIRNISKSTLRNRIINGWPIDQALEFSLRTKKSNRNPKYITYGGEKKTIAEWAKCRGMKESALRGRLSHGWSIESALDLSIDKLYSSGKKPATIAYNGEIHSVPEWAVIRNIPESTIRSRLRKFKWPVGQALGFEERTK